MSDASTIKPKLIAWIKGRSKQKQLEVFDDTLLLEKGILSSLDIVEFVVYLESLREEEVDTDLLVPESFATVDAIYATFFS